MPLSKQSIKSLVLSGMILSILPLSYATFNHGSNHFEQYSSDNKHHMIKEGYGFLWKDSVSINEWNGYLGPEKELEITIEESGKITEYVDGGKDGPYDELVDTITYRESNNKIIKQFKREKNLEDNLEEFDKADQYLKRIKQKYKGRLILE